MYGLAVYVKEVVPFAWHFSLENSLNSCLFLIGSTALSVVLLFPLLITFFTCFYSISSNIDEVLLVNPTVNMFALRDFYVYHTDLLTYSGGSDRSGELCQMTLILLHSS